MSPFTSTSCWPETVTMPPSTSVFTLPANLALFVASTATVLDASTLGGGLI